MTNKDVQAFARENWADKTDTISSISSSGNRRTTGQECILVDNDTLIYSFDNINAIFYPNNKPDSVDGLFFVKKKICFVEFKTGFRKIVTRENYPSTMRIPCDKSECEGYTKLFFKNQDNETKIIRHSIKTKALETYITLEKQIFPKCKEVPKKMNLYLYIVIDEDPIEEMEDILFDLTPAQKKNPQKDTECSKLRESLKRYIKAKDCDGNEYFYDEIEVMPASKFKNLINEINSKTTTLL